MSPRAHPVLVRMVQPRLQSYTRPQPRLHPPPCPHPHSPVTTHARTQARLMGQHGRQEWRTLLQKEKRTRISTKLKRTCTFSREVGTSLSSITPRFVRHTISHRHFSSLCPLHSISFPRHLTAPIRSAATHLRHLC